MPLAQRQGTRWRIRGGRWRAASSTRAGPRRLPFDQTLSKTARASQAPLEPPHLAVIPFVIIAKKVQQTVQGKHPKLCPQTVTCTTRLSPRNPKRDHHIAQHASFLGRERQHVRSRIFSTIASIEFLHS